MKEIKLLTLPVLKLMVSGLKRFSTWVVILTLLFLSVDGIYMFAIEISGETKQKAIEHIWNYILLSLMITTGLLIVFQYPVRRFRNTIEGFLLILSLILLVSFSFVGNHIFTGYLILIYVVISPVLIFFEKLLLSKQKAYNIGNMTITEGKTIGLGHELPENIKKSDGTMRF